MIGLGFSWIAELSGGFFHGIGNLSMEFGRSLLGLDKLRNWFAFLRIKLVSLDSGFWFFFRIGSGFSLDVDGFSLDSLDLIGLGFAFLQDKVGFSRIGFSFYVRVTYISTGSETKCNRDTALFLKII